LARVACKEKLKKVWTKQQFVFGIPKLVTYKPSALQVEEVAKKAKAIKESQKKIKHECTSFKPCFKYFLVMSEYLARLQ
jgi:hypothetical protein